VATGMAADTLTAMSYPAAHTVAGAVIERGQPILLDDVDSQSDYTINAKEQVPIGAVMGLPLAGTSQPRGTLLVARLTGRRRFSAADLEMATAFANHAAVALELTDARADQQRVALLEDRDRIARDLHDHVIQRLFAAGLTVQSLEATTASAESRVRLEQVVTDLDDTIRQIRTSIFALRGSLSPTEPTLRAALLAIVGEHSAQLGFDPSLRFSGAVDSAVTGSVVDDVIAVAREALSNIARHSGATAAELEVQVDANELLLTVDDNGVGIGAADRRSGLENMRARAEHNNGTFEVTSADNEGTHLRWMIKIN
jgi:two-component system, NarL family, sensor histidine kinase DevS